VKGFLGPERGEWEHWVCGFLPDRTPDAAACGQDAVWHGFTLDETGQHVSAMMSSCEEHLPAMRLSADYVHPHQHPCGIPGSEFWWPENECRMNWDDAELLAGELQEAGA
jgi:hypothetical protein